MKLCLLIAAAGQSLRMGFPKALMPIQGKPAALYLAGHISPSTIQQAFITVPIELFTHSDLRQALSSYGLKVRLNLYPKAGYSGSINSIIEEINQEFQGILITPIDAPFLSHALFIALKNMITLCPSQSIIVPCFGPSPGHPIYFSNSFFKELRRTDRKGGLRGLMDKNKKFVRRFSFPSVRILANINSQVDLLAWNHIHADFKR